MLAILGTLSLVGGFVLLRYAVFANRRPVRPAWTKNPVVGAILAPLVSTLLAAGVILLIRFALDFEATATAFAQIAASLVILSAGVFAWKYWTPAAGAGSTGLPAGEAPPLPNPANDPAGPDSRTPGGHGRSRRAA